MGGLMGGGHNLMGEQKLMAELDGRPDGRAELDGRADGRAEGRGPELDGSG
jgi:hypothetical protein